MSLCDYQSPGSCGCVREYGHPGYLSQRCRFIGILHAAPDYTRHEES